MKNTIGMLILILIVTLSCKTPQVQIDPALRAKPLSVKGTQGLMIGQVVRFGDFYTDKVKRGWVNQYDIPFFVRFKGASEKLSFTQFGPDKVKAEVSCISRFRSKELEVLGDFFAIPLKHENYFAGNILLSDGAATWDFVLHNPDGDFQREVSSAGIARYHNKVIEITAIRSLHNQPSWMSKFTVYGYHFYLDGKPLGAVSIMNRGTVWLEREVSPEIKIVIASLATALLLRTDVENLT